jgi:small subunit ribosomal protein S4
MVNGRNNDIASTILKPGDTVLVKENSKQNTYFKTLRQSEETRTPPAWVDSDVDKLTGRVIRLPERAEIDGNLNEQLIVEYYSR